MSLAAKLKYKGGPVLAINSPGDYEALTGIAGAVNTPSQSQQYSLVHIFVRNEAGLKKLVPHLTSWMASDGITWISFPKGSSGMQTDLSRDKGWDSLNGLPLKWITLISVNDQWSAFGLRHGESNYWPEAHKENIKTGKEADRASRTIEIPADVQQALAPYPETLEYFNRLAFTHRREYIEWITSAKRDETRIRRIQQAVEKLRNNEKLR